MSAIDIGDYRRRRQQPQGEENIDLWVCNSVHNIGRILEQIDLKFGKKFPYLRKVLDSFFARAISAKDAESRKNLMMSTYERLIELMSAIIQDQIHDGVMSIDLVASYYFLLLNIDDVVASMFSEAHDSEAEQLRLFEPEQEGGR